jgi:HTH-type transcriptional regulator / antitoxin HipB
MLTTHDIGVLIRNTRKSLRLTQKDLAFTSNTGLRFIIELEQGKPTCQVGKVITVMQTLGMQIEIKLPAYP